MVTMAEVVTGVGFVLAVDNCARGCLHCPAYGARQLVQRAPLPRLARTLISLARARRALGLSPPRHVVHCWRISDPLDYVVRRRSGAVATCAELARLWRSSLGQGLYVVTNGSEGRPLARRALARLAAEPDLLSQVKLTITPADRAWGTHRFEHDLAADVRVLAPLWRLPSARAEDPHGRRFRINVKTTPAHADDTMATVGRILRLAGISAQEAERACAEPTKVKVKPIYDLGNALGAPSPVSEAIDLRTRNGARYKPTPEVRGRIQYGIRPDGRLFVVDMYAFTERDLTDQVGKPLRWPSQRLSSADLATPLGER